MFSETFMYVWIQTLWVDKFLETTSDAIQAASPPSLPTKTFSKISRSVRRDRVYVYQLSSLDTDSQMDLVLGFDWAMINYRYALT